MVLSHDQSGLHIFPRKGIRQPPRGSLVVDGMGCNDKHMVTIDYAICASGVVLAPQGIFEDIMERSLPANSDEYAQKGWQLRYSNNHWSSTS